MLFLVITRSSSVNALLPNEMHEGDGEPCMFSASVVTWSPVRFIGFSVRPTAPYAER